LVAAIQLFYVQVNRLKPVEKPVAGRGKPCNAGRLRKAEGCRPYRLRYNHALTLVAAIFEQLVFSRLLLSTGWNVSPGGWNGSSGR